MTTLSSLRLSKQVSYGGTGLDSAEVSSLTASVGITYYNTLDSLPLSDLTAGDRGFVVENQRLYISNGSGWYNAALVNLSPSIDSIGGYVSALDSGDTLTMSIIASDSDDVITSFGATINPSNATDSGVTTFSRDSSVVSLAVGAGSLENFDITFTANDTINTGTLTKSFTITRDTNTYITSAEWTGIGTAAYDNAAGTWSWNNSTKVWSLTTQTSTFADFRSSIVPNSYLSSPFWIYLKHTGCGTAFSDRSAIGYILYTDTTSTTTNYASASSSYDAQMALRTDTGNVNNENNGTNDALLSAFGGGTSWYSLFYWNGDNQAEIWWYKSASAPSAASAWSKMQSFDYDSISQTVQGIRIWHSSRNTTGDATQILDASTAPLPTPGI